MLRKDADPATNGVAAGKAARPSATEADVVSVRRLAEIVKQGNLSELASQVLDANGEPQVVYHGTVADITQFDPRKSGIGKSFFFSADPSFASSPAYTGSSRSGGNVMPVFLNIRNPYRIDRKESYNPFIEGGIIHRSWVQKYQFRGR